ncbi:MAG: YdcF family protein [Candidatus Nucleicultricaceae bacterium]
MYCFMIRTLFLMSVAWLIGFIIFGFCLPSEPKENPSKTDAIVVLTGGNKRIQVALELLDQKKAEKLFISGVNQKVTLDELLALHPEYTITRDSITLGYTSNTTIQNAKEVSDWLMKNDVKSLRLVTSHYHMPRSSLELRMLRPNCMVVQHPVLSEKFNQNPWWWEHNAWIVFLEYNKFLATSGRYLMSRVNL